MNLGSLTLPAGALLALASLPSAQKPSAELVSLLDVGFYERTGGFMAGGLCLVFPPEGQASYELVVRDAAGTVKGKAGLQVQGWSGLSVFDGLESLGVPVFQVGEAGSYVMSVDLNGEPITSYSFTMTAEESGDPFNPSTTFRREGPWRELGFLASPTGAPDQPLAFHFWTNADELPEAKPQRADVRVLLGDELVALYKDPVSVSGTKWRRHRRNLVTPEEPTGNHAFTLNKILARPGEYTVRVESGGEVVKSWPFLVKQGKVSAHARTDFSTEPRTDYMVPKYIDRSAGSSGGYRSFDVFWLESKDARK